MKTDIRWPERFLPANSAVFVSNEITVAAEPETVWRWLIRAESWPEWYPKSSDIHFVSTSGPDLRERTRFRWSTYGFRITSKVLEFEPFMRLAWEAQGIGVDAYHAWLLTPTADGGTHILTQETQHGWLASMLHGVLPRRLQNKHQIWLESLKERAQAGPLPELLEAVRRPAQGRSAAGYSES